jgi:hypothetical protein
MQQLPRRQPEMTKHYKVAVALALFFSAVFSAYAATPAPKVFLMTQMAEGTINTSNLKLEGGYLRNVMQGNANACPFNASD